MRMMHTAYGKPVILLIDEYDVPLAKAHANGYYRQMLDVIRGMMNASLKTNDDLKFAVVTGCLRIPKESIFTGVNNFVSYSVLNDRFSQYFGFTDAEVKKMLNYFGLSEKEEVNGTGMMAISSEKRRSTAHGMLQAIYLIFCMTIMPCRKIIGKYQLQ